MGFPSSDPLGGAARPPGRSVFFHEQQHDHAAPAAALAAHVADADPHNGYVLESDLNAAWTAWTPTISGTGWALGNGTITARYKRVGDKTVHVAIHVAWGSTSTYGAGDLRLSLPFAPFAVLPIGPAAANRSAAAGYTAGIAIVDTSNATILCRWPGSPATTVSTYPFTWATSDVLRLSGTYEAA